MNETAQCPTCLTWFQTDGPEGLFPHIVSEHPATPIADRIACIALEADFEGGTISG